MGQRLNLPNAITISRMLLAIPIAIMLIKNQYKWAVYLFLVASISDLLDGFLARKLNQQTKLGAILDPLADKILINYTFVILTSQGYLPVLLFAVVLSKDIILVAGSIIEVLSLKNLQQIEIKASVFGKISTFSQIVVIVLVFLKIFKIYFNKSVFSFFIYSTIFLTILALFSYINEYQNRNQTKGG